jgi:hypothetical protein
MSASSQTSTTPSKQQQQQQQQQQQEPRQQQYSICMAPEVSDFSIIELQVFCRFEPHFILIGPLPPHPLPPPFPCSISPPSPLLHPQGSIESRDGPTASAASLPLGASSSCAASAAHYVILSRRCRHPFARFEQRRVCSVDRQSEAFRFLL